MDQAELSLPPAPDSVSAARRFVERTLAGWELQSVGWTAAQLVSELATNAVLHAATEFTVQLSRHGDTVRIGFADGSPVTPSVRHYRSDATTGRGLRLVDTMSSAWGVDTHEVGKTIWFEIAIDLRGTVRTWDDDEDVDLDLLMSQFDDEPSGTVTSLSAVARAHVGDLLLSA